MIFYTKRLQLRKFRPDDLPGLHAYLSDHEVVKFEPYDALTMDQCLEFLTHMIDSTEFWAVCLKDSGLVIGQIYLSEEDQQNWKIGYVMNRHYWHKGYMTEAVPLFINHVFSECGGHRISADCNPDNTASWHLLERLEFQREGHLRKNIHFKTDLNGMPLWQDTYIYGLLASDMKI